MGTSLADPGVSVTGTYTGGGRGVLAILRSLRRGDGHLTHAGAAPGRARVMTGSTAALLSAPLSAAPQGTVAVPRAAATLRASPATRPGHPHTHKGRHHRQAHKHRAASTGRTAPGPQAPGPQAPGPQAPGAPPPGPSRTGPVTTGRTTAGRGKHRAHPRTPRLRVARHGFDSCTTPSLAAMRAWRRAFSAMAVYIGGVEAGCASRT